ncbi:hypothetical protein GWI33_022944 [Rhynchophorus ferrugineus]|uniref:Uncharacterized protein n=1 Tax=Rhynchophorus ferrugineus TaxID=354439 RepID=A0A834ITS0_RHYFE|nr:hypothetical protein GWI33_022944 [Rhynchophorus ferrugineus]
MLSNELTSTGVLYQMTEEIRRKLNKGKVGDIVRIPQGWILLDDVALVIVSQTRIALENISDTALLQIDTCMKQMRLLARKTKGTTDSNIFAKGIKAIPGGDRKIFSSYGDDLSAGEMSSLINPDKD